MLIGDMDCRLLWSAYTLPQVCKTSVSDGLGESLGSSLIRVSLRVQSAIIYNL